MTYGRGALGNLGNNRAFWASEAQEIQMLGLWLRGLDTLDIARLTNLSEQFVYARLPILRQAASQDQEWNFDQPSEGSNGRTGVQHRRIPDRVPRLS
jgi:hypothetical protein